MREEGKEERGQKREEDRERKEDKKGKRKEKDKKERQRKGCIPASLYMKMIEIQSRQIIETIIANALSMKQIT